MVVVVLVAVVVVIVVVVVVVVVAAGAAAAVVVVVVVVVVVAERLHLMNALEICIVLCSATLGVSLSCASRASSKWTSQTPKLTMVSFKSASISVMWL